IYRHRVSIRTRVRRARIISGERDGIDHRNGIDARSGLKFGLQSFGKAPKRSGIGILRRRQSDASSPYTFRTKSHFLSAEPHETVQSARHNPAAPAITLTKVLSSTNSRTMPLRSAPSAMRNAISRRRAVKRTSNKFATLLQAMSSTAPTAASNVINAGRKFPV